MDVAVVVRVIVVAREEVGQRRRRAALGNESPRGAEETEVDRRVERDGSGGKLAQEGRIARFGIGLAKLQKIGPAQLAGPGADGGTKGLPEFRVDVLDRVDPVAVHAEFEPLAEDLDEALHDARVLGEEIVESAEVPIHRVFPLEGAVAAVVVESDVVQPRGILHGFLRLRHDWHVRKTALGGQGRERGWIVEPVEGERAVIEGPPLRVTEGRRRLVDVGCAAVGELDHISGVIDDDVHVDTQAAGVRLADELAEFIIRAQVRVDPQEIRDPVTMVACAASLHGLVCEWRRHPHHGNPQMLQVIQVGRETGKIPAVIMRDARRIEARDFGSAVEAAAVVGSGAVGKAICEHKVDSLTRTRMGETRHGDGRDRLGPGQRHQPGQHASQAHQGKSHGADPKWRTASSGQPALPVESLHGREKT